MARSRMVPPQRAQGAEQLRPGPACPSCKRRPGPAPARLAPCNCTAAAAAAGPPGLPKAGAPAPARRALGAGRLRAPLSAAAGGRSRASAPGTPRCRSGAPTLTTRRPGRRHAPLRRRAGRSALGATAGCPGGLCARRSAGRPAPRASRRPGRALRAPERQALCASRRHARTSAACRCALLIAPLIT